MLTSSKSSVALMALLVAGCAASGKSNFSCDGPTPGVGCLPASDVYEITNDPELAAAVRRELQAAAASGEDFDPQEIISEVRATYRPRAEVPKQMAEPVAQPLPVLTPAHVIRIWIDAWIDRKGDLHMPGYVFTEVTPRRWNIGEPGVSDAPILAPIQIDRSGQIQGQNDSAER